ncbi:xylulose kinase [Thraustotheca clavata]|uniref:Xylulose kinase n=1 Tax=Thraustotheca clavata TaxID=74557 RepID=A0A1V9ZD10_9STRA|nr:xylulose kinase [Thraustotheca clavata]
MNNWVRSGLQNVVDGSRRLKEEILQNAGVYGAGYTDPVLEMRTQRYAQHSAAIERLHAATAAYVKQLDALANSSSVLMLEFKEYFNMQKTHCRDMNLDEKFDLNVALGQDEETDKRVEQLANAAECLEGLHQTLKQHVVNASTHMLNEKVLKPLAKLKQDSVNTQKMIQQRKQKILDFDALRRSTGTSRPSPEAQMRLRTSEEAVVAVTTQLNSALDTVEIQRGYLLRRELLCVAASHVYTSMKSHDAYQQLIPLMPGMAFRLTELSSLSKPDFLLDPTKALNLGILDYSGPSSVLTTPLNSMNLIDFSPEQPTQVPRLNSQDGFQKIHAAQQLAQELYPTIPTSTTGNATPTSSNPSDAFEVDVCDGDPVIGTALMHERRKLVQDMEKDPNNIEILSRLLDNCSRLFSQYPQKIELLYRRIISRFQRENLDEKGAFLYVRMLLTLAEMLAADHMKKRDILSQGTFSPLVKGQVEYFEYFARFEMEQNRTYSAEELLKKAVEKDYISDTQREAIWARVHNVKPVTSPREFVTRPSPMQSTRKSYHSTPLQSNSDKKPAVETPATQDSHTISSLRTTTLANPLQTPVSDSSAKRDSRSTQRKNIMRPKFKFGLGLPMRVRQSEEPMSSPDEEIDKENKRPLANAVAKEPPKLQKLTPPIQKTNIDYIKDWKPTRSSPVSSGKAKRALGYLDPNSEVHNVPESPSVSDDASDMEIELSRFSQTVKEEVIAPASKKTTPPTHNRSPGPNIRATPTTSQDSPTDAALATPFRNVNASDQLIPWLIDSKNHFVVNGVKFLNLKQIGSGGSSKVFRVLGPDMQTYALKKIKMKKMDEKSIISYENEIMLLKRLQGSPYIIRLLANEMDYVGQAIYVVMEQGEIDLKDKLQELKRNGIAVEENFLRITWQQMLQAVNYIHNERIIHGDLKPANFLFVNGALKLIDFGIAKAISNDTTNIIRENHEGTANFMPPEVASGFLNSNQPNAPRKVGRAADIWSLGCILYQIVYGDTPFGTFNNIIEKFIRISDKNHPIKFRQLHNKHLEDVIRSCLQHDPKQRPTIEGPNGLLEHPFLNPNKEVVTPANLKSILQKASLCIREHGCSLDVVDVVDQLLADVEYHHQAHLFECGMLCLGLDCSTQSMSGVVIAVPGSYKPFDVVAYSTFQLDHRLPHYGTNKGVVMKEVHVEVPSAMLVEALDAILADLEQSLVATGFSMADIKAVSGSAQQHTSVFWQNSVLAMPQNARISLVEHLKMAFSPANGRSWMDASTTKEGRALEEAIGGSQRLADITGSRAYERFTGIQLLSMTHVLDKVGRCSIASSMLTSLFLGRYAGIDQSDGSGMNLMDLKTRQWSPDVLEAVERVGGPRMSEMRRLLGEEPVASHESQGPIASYFTQRYGMPPNCVVIPFSGDNPCTLAGMGLCKVGDVGISLGTSGCLFVVASPSAIHPSGEEGHVLTNPVDPNTLMGMLCFKNGSLARENVRDRRAQGLWSNFTSLMASTPAGNNGIMGFYYLQPEITPVVPTESAAQTLSGIYGYDANNNEIDLLNALAAVEIRAIVEWQCLAMYCHLKKLYNGPITRLILAGGASVNPALLETLANVFNAPVFIEDNQVNTAALGGALRAKHGLDCHQTGQFVSYEPNVHLELRASPVPATFPIYQEMINRFHTLEAKAIASQYKRFGVANDPQERKAQATKLRALIEEAADQRDELQQTNAMMQRKIAPLLQKKQDTSSEKKEDRLSAVENEKRYYDCLNSVHEARVQLTTAQTQYDRIAMELQARLDEKECKANEIHESFMEFKREVARSAENTRTGKPIPKRIITQFEVAEVKKDQEVEKVRLKNINLRTHLRKLEQQLHAKEQLAEGLHLIDFEQLKIENQTLNEKIEERNEELHKLRKKTTTTVQVLTHIKEKLQFVLVDNQALKQELANLDEELTKSRDVLTKRKKERDALRHTQAKMKHQEGFTNSILLMQDYEKRKIDIEDYQGRLEQLKQRLAYLNKKKPV